MAESVVARAPIPDAIRRGLLGVLPDRSGYAFAVPADAETLECPVCHHAIGLGLYVQPYLELADAPAWLAAAWVYHCFGCPTPAIDVAAQVAA